MNYSTRLVYICEECKKKFNTKEKFEEHYRKDHLAKLEEEAICNIAIRLKKINNDLHKICKTKPYTMQEHLCSLQAHYRIKEYYLDKTYEYETLNDTYDEFVEKNQLFNLKLLSKNMEIFSDFQDEITNNINNLIEEYIDN